MKHEMKKPKMEHAHKKHEKMHKLATGGKVEGNEELHVNENEIKEAEGKAKGGAVKKKHMKDHGKKPMPRLDKKARGGKIVTPKSPLSGAAPTKMRPGFGESTLDKSDD